MAASSTRFTPNEPALQTMSRGRSSRSILPGFGLSLGFTLAYLGLIALLAGALPSDPPPRLPIASISSSAPGMISDRAR